MLQGTQGLSCIFAESGGIYDRINDIMLREVMPLLLHSTHIPDRPIIYCIFPPNKIYVM
jgi:hypothetical protein